MKNDVDRGTQTRVKNMDICLTLPELMLDSPIAGYYLLIDAVGTEG